MFGASSRLRLAAALWPLHWPRSLPRPALRKPIDLSLNVFYTNPTNVIPAAPGSSSPKAAISASPASNRAHQEH